jgi:hypothetical protein
MPRSILKGFDGVEKKFQRFEVATSGLDEGLQGISSNPFTNSGFSNYTGLRVPPVLNRTILPGQQPRYLFQLCSRRITSPTRIVGLRQGLTIGVDANGGTPPERPMEMFVRTPTFRFVDGNVSWHLVHETAPDITVTSPTSNTQNWAFFGSDSPAMLYQTFSNSNINPVTGAPVIYNVGLTAYTPPQPSQQWIPLGNLGCFNDIRFPWDRVVDDLDILVDGNGRISLYASVLQSNPAERGNPANPVTNLSAYAAPEEAFIEDLTFSVDEVNDGPVYWRIMGGIVFEDPVGAR